MSVREAYIAGSSGSRVNPGTTNKERVAFNRGRKSYRNKFNRNKFKPDRSQRRGFLGDLKQMGSDLSNIGPIRDATNMAKDVIVDPTKKGIGKFQEVMFPLLQSGMKFVKNIGDNRAQARQNKEILGDLYTDDLRKSMMTDDNLAFYNKYKRLADLTSDNTEKARLMDVANTALRNAQITRRINYGLGDLGFDTVATPGVANIDYSTLANRMVGGTDNSMGLEGTAAGKEFLKRASIAQANETGAGMIGNQLANYGDLRPTYTVPVTDEGMEQMGLIENLSPFELYKMRSQIQGRGGFTQPSAGAIAEYATDINNITPGAAILGMQGLDPSIISNMNIAYVPPGFGDEDEDENFMGYNRI